MNKVRTDDEWWRLENVLLDHRNAALWLGAGVAVLMGALLTRCQGLPNLAGYPGWQGCPSISTAADIGVAVGTIPLS